MSLNDLHNHLLLDHQSTSAKYVSGNTIITFSLLQVSLEADSSHAKKLKADIAKLEGEVYEALQIQECMCMGCSCFLEMISVTLWKHYTGDSQADANSILVT